MDARVHKHTVMTLGSYRVASPTLGCLYPRNAPVLFYRRLCVPQDQSGHEGVKNPPSPGIEPGPTSPSCAWSTWPTVTLYINRNVNWYSCIFYQILLRKWKWTLRFFSFLSFCFLYLFSLNVRLTPPWLIIQMPVHPMPLRGARLWTTTLDVIWAELPKFMVSKMCGPPPETTQAEDTTQDRN